MSKRRSGLQVGAILDEKYELLEHVAEGGMGSIFRSRRLSDDAVVATKLLHRRFLEDEEAVERFMREAETISRLQHPGIIQVFGYGFDSPNNELYLAMEWLEGSDVDHIIQSEGTLDPAYAAWIALQTSRCLSYAHQQGVIHRDLKPENIFVIPGPTPAEDLVKVLDFGIAKVLNNPKQLEITRVGTVCGTPEYMSPEQARASAVDGRSDMYSLGCVMFAMLTGHAPFKDVNPIMVMIQQQSDPIPPLPDSVPAQLRDIITQATQKKPAQRQPSIDAFAKQLDAFLNHQPAPDISKFPAPAAVLKNPNALRISSAGNKKLSPELIAAERDRISLGGPARVSSTALHKLSPDQIKEASLAADLRISSGTISKLSLDPYEPDPSLDADPTPPSEVSAVVSPDDALPDPSPPAPLPPAPGLLKPLPKPAPTPTPTAAPTASASATSASKPTSPSTQPQRPTPHKKTSQGEKLLWIFVGLLALVVVILFAALMAK